MRRPMEFRTSARSSSSVSHRRGVQCTENCDCLNDLVAAIGRQWLDLSRRCLEKTGLPGEQVSPDKTSTDFTKKSAIGERLRGFSKSAKLLAMNLTYPPEPIIHIIRSPKQTCGVTTPARPITTDTS